MKNYKSYFILNPSGKLDMIDNERYLYKEILELKENIKKNRKEFEREKRKYNQIYGMTARKQNDYISKDKIKEIIKSINIFYLMRV